MVRRFLQGPFIWFLLFLMFAVAGWALQVNVSGTAATFSTANIAYVTGTGNERIGLVPMDANTVLLLHCDKDFTDSSGNNRSVTAIGNVIIDSTTSVFGGASCFFNGLDDQYLSAGTLPGLGTGDFTVDFRFKTADASQFDNRNRTPVCLGNPTTYDTSNITISNATGTMIILTKDSSYTITGVTNCTDNTWRHFAHVRSAGNAKMFVNGTQEGSTLADATSYLPKLFVIGSSTRRFNQGNFNGYLDEIRVSDIARWTSAFTPPTDFYQTYSTGETATFANVIFRTRQTLLNNQILFPSSTLVTNSDIQVALSVDGGAFTAFYNVGGYNGTTPDTTSRLYHPLGFSSLTGRIWGVKVKLNSNGVDYQEIGRPILGNYVENPQRVLMR